MAMNKPVAVDPANPNQKPTVPKEPDPRPGGADPLPPPPPAAPYIPPTPVAPTSEMGMIIEMMINQGIMSRGVPVPTSATGSNVVPPNTNTTERPAGSTVPGAPGGAPTQQDNPRNTPPLGGTPAGTPPANWVQVNGRWVDPGVAAPVLPDAEFQQMMQDLMRLNYQIPVDSPLYAHRNEILREIRRRDPNAVLQGVGIGGGGDSTGTQGIQFNFNPTLMANAPVNEAATPALRSLLASGLYGPGGGGQLDAYGYDSYDGEQMLRQLQAYDPSAHWEDVPGTGTGSGGEGGLSNQGSRRLVYDRSKLPISQAEAHGWDLAPVYDDTRMIRPEMTYYDPIYGRVTDKRNIKQDPAKWWEVAAPIAISMLAPYAAPAMFGAMGAGGMALGATSAITGGAAGLGAANIPGAAAAAGAGLALPQQLPWYYSKPLTSAPQIGRTVAGLTQTPYRPGAPDLTRTSTVPVRQPGSTAAPPPAPNTTTTTTRTPLGQSAGYTPQNFGKSAGAPLARNQTLNDPYGASAQQGVVTPRTARYGDAFGFDPSAFNSGGSTTKPVSRDSKLVATQFADDPYRFS